ncbi:MAG: bifunctional diaminohydroxyphosphoribosylaminopyrimidine deaminase/5-amino-6-(5-phosphoribosylamino)uracil reductase RibD [Pseudomonadota bacterium]
MKTIDEKWMALALGEARKAWGRTSPNPMVGAVVVKDGKVMAKGFHARAGAAHAEAAALKKAGERARGADLYVTLEPCNHHGRTPPCTEAVLASGASRVIIGQMDPNPHVAGGGAEYLRSRGLAVTTGVLERECAGLNEFFNKFVAAGRPFVILKSAATLDGKLATRTGSSRWITGEKSRALVHHLRDGVDAILVGRNTVAVDNPRLDARPPGRRPGRDPLRIVLDANLALPVESRVFDPQYGGPAIVACGPDCDPARVEAFQKNEVEVWPLPLVNGRVSLAALLDGLGRRNITSLLIEGGGEINESALLVEKIVDRVLFFYAPKIVGGRQAPTLVDGLGVETMDLALNLEINEIKRLGPDLLITASPRY